MEVWWDENGDVGWFALEGEREKGRRLRWEVDGCMMDGSY